MQDAAYKQCTRCDVVKPLEQFYRRSATKRHACCIECTLVQKAAERRARGVPERGPQPNSGRRRCGRCGVIQPLDRFRQHTRDGWSARCRDCDIIMGREYRERHRALVNERARERHRKSPWKAADLQRQRVARELGAVVEPVERMIVYVDHGGRCGICGLFIEGAFHVDHIIPLSRGGVHSYANTQPSHPGCNLRKWAHLPKELSHEGYTHTPRSVDRTVAEAASDDSASDGLLEHLAGRDERVATRP